MKQQKGQIQLGESIFVVFIIIFLIVFGLVFYSNAEEDSFLDEVVIFDDLDTISLTQYLTSMTELECSVQRVRIPNCYDVTKLRAFIKLVNFDDSNIPKEFYFSQLGNSKFQITQVYPDFNGFSSDNIYENLPVVDESNQIDTNKLPQISVQLPVTLFNSVTETYAFGVLSITKYI